VVLIGKMESGKNIQAEGKEIEKVTKAVTLGSVVSQDSSISVTWAVWYHKTAAAIKTLRQ